MARDELIRQAFAWGSYSTLGVQMPRFNLEEASPSQFPTDHDCLVQPDLARVYFQLEAKRGLDIS